MNDVMKTLKKLPNLKSRLINLEDILKEEDKLRSEFYDAIDEDDKAEFINGKVVRQSTGTLREAQCSSNLFILLIGFTMKYNLGGVFAEKLMVELTRNSYQPDIVFFNKKKINGFKPEQLLFPAPDFIAEILSPSTEKNDRGIKFEDYALHNVTEYWLADPAKKTIEQYLLQHGKYQLEFKGKNGMITSKAIKGFSINAKAVFSKPENMKALQQLMA